MSKEWTPEFRKLHEEMGKKLEKDKEIRREMEKEWEREREAEIAENSEEIELEIDDPLLMKLSEMADGIVRDLSYQVDDALKGIDIDFIDNAKEILALDAIVSGQQQLSPDTNVSGLSRFSDEELLKVCIICSM